MNYPRTDLCPDCNTRLNLEPEYTEHTLVDYPVVLEYDGVFYTTIHCNGCRGLWTKQQVLDYWTQFCSVSGTPDADSIV